MHKLIFYKLTVYRHWKIPRDNGQFLFFIYNIFGRQRSIASEHNLNFFRRQKSESIQMVDMNFGFLANCPNPTYFLKSNNSLGQFRTLFYFSADLLCHILSIFSICLDYVLSAHDQINWLRTNGRSCHNVIIHLVKNVQTRVPTWDNTKSIIVCQFLRLGFLKIFSSVF